MTTTSKHESEDDTMTLERTKVLYKLDMFKYLFGALFAWSDVGSDIATCVLYFQSYKYTRFGFCLAFALAPPVAMALAHLMQHIKNDGVGKTCKDLFNFGFFGSGVLKVHLFTLCVRNRKEVCSRDGYLVNKDEEKNLLRSSLVFSFVQALMEDIPQMILQLHTLNDQQESIHWIQIASLTLSLINLVSTLANFENRTLPGVQDVKAYFLIIVTYNLVLLVARVVTIVSFIVAYRWVTAAVLGAHEIICILIYYYRNRQRFAETDIWWVAVLILPCYIFIYLGFTVKQIRLRAFELKISRSLLSSGIYYGIFAVENVMMMTLYYSEASTRKWYSSGATAAVILLTLVGIFLNLVFTSLYFREYRHTRHVLSLQGARRSSRYERNSRVRFSRSVRVHPHPNDQDQTVTEIQT